MIYFDINSKETTINYKLFAKQHNNNGYVDGKRIVGYKMLDDKHLKIFQTILYIFIRRNFDKNRKKVFSYYPTFNIGYWDIQNVIGEKVGLNKRTISNRINRLVEVGVFRFSIRAKSGTNIAISENIISYKKLSENELNELKKERFLKKIQKTNTATKIAEKPKEDIFFTENGSDSHCSIKDYVNININNKEKSTFSQNENKNILKNKKVALQPKSKKIEHPKNSLNYFFKSKIDKILNVPGNEKFVNSLKISVLAMYYKIIVELFQNKADDYNIDSAPEIYHEFIIETISYLANYPSYYGNCQNLSDIKRTETKLNWGINSVKKYLKKNNKNLDLTYPNRYIKPTNSKGFNTIVTSWWNNSKIPFYEWSSENSKTDKIIKNKNKEILITSKTNQILWFLCRVQANDEMVNKAILYARNNLAETYNEFLNKLERVKINDKNYISSLFETKLNDKFLKIVFGNYEGSIDVGDKFFDKILSVINNKIIRLSLIPQNKEIKNLQKYAIKNNNVWKTRNRSLKTYRALENIKDRLFKIY